MTGQLIPFPNGKRKKSTKSTDKKSTDKSSKKSAKKSAADKISDAETDKKTHLLRRAEELADTVIEAAREDVSLRFLDSDRGSDEELGSLDLSGDDYDPIVDRKTGATLSEAIEDFAEKLDLPSKWLRHIYVRTLRKKWKSQPKTKIPTAPVGKMYGPYMVTRHGVWAKQHAAGSGLYVWRRLAERKLIPQPSPAISPRSATGSITMSSATIPASFRSLSAPSIWSRPPTAPSPF
jgi:hypothetical protein